jgi:hypothetical protein
LTWKPKAPSSHPTDYFVPNFGADHEIAASHEHSKAAETSLKHEWNPTQNEDGKWIVPEPDRDFQPTHNYLQLNSEREPLLTWEPKNSGSHPMNYYVPNFG